MTIDRPVLKRQARLIIRQSLPGILVASAIYIALSALLNFLSSQLNAVSYEQYADYMRYLQEGSYYYAMDVLEKLNPSPSVQLITAALRLMGLFLGVGFTVYLYNTLRGLGPVYGNLLDGFGPYFRVVLLRLVMGVFIALWSLVFFFPGIVAAYRYSMAPFILLEHPDYSIMQCIRESKRMSYGYKGQLFVLDLSMLLWLLLSMLPIVGYLVQVWYRPYHDLCYLLFYDQLRLGENASASCA